ncbi:MAG: SAF domain-containing protein [Armatimonadota bacterium]|nr:SAF domain-containing protein [Armatimonadota bacterium]
MTALLDRLTQRAASGRPLQVGVVGTGKFATMFLAQARRLRGLQVLGVADLVPDRARSALLRAGWPEEAIGTTFVTDDAQALIHTPGLHVLVESTGLPAAGIRHALAAIEAGVHLVMVNVEADALAGPLLARRARERGVVYSLAYGDQPALICELVDWARAAGFEVTAAGKGTKYLPAYHASTPDTVWEHYGLTAEQAARGGMNPRMFNSFLDGTKSAIEMAAVANATGLVPQPEGLGFPPAGVGDLPRVCRPRQVGGTLAHGGTVEVVSSLYRDGRQVDGDLRWGVYVTFEAPGDYVARCFAEYGLVTDESGRYAALYRPYHLVGLELSVSVLRVGLLGEPTGAPVAFQGDVVAAAKRDLRAGERLDGEGGYTVYGVLRRAEESVRARMLPIGLAHGVRLVRDVRAGEVVRYGDVEVDAWDPTLRVRREMEAACLPA